MKLPNGKGITGKIRIVTENDEDGKKEKQETWRMKIAKKTGKQEHIKQNI